MARYNNAVLTNLQYRLLMKIAPREPNVCTGRAYLRKTKVETLLGKEFLSRIRGKTIIDFGCGQGLEAIELAERGAELVIGIDIREDLLEMARLNAARAGFDERCCFASSTTHAADFIISLDAFEHFQDPAAVLRQMEALLKAGGEVVAAFGPTWYHPLGGHLFSVFPWAHLVFGEEPLIRWRSNFKTDGATRFSETAGGLNQMSIKKFERLIDGSPFQFAALELLPIRRLGRVHNRLTREFTTAIVRCRLTKRGTGQPAS
jgi:SAM-dependent methyltransferase